MVVLFYQYTENTHFFFNLSAGGFCDWGILSVISLEFQGNKASTVFYDTALSNAFGVFAEPVKHVFSVPVAVGKTVPCIKRLKTKMDKEPRGVPDGRCYFRVGV